MRINSFKAIILAVVSVWLAVSVETGWAQPLQLVTMDAMWRYNQSGANLLTAWRAAAYNDSAAGWEGPGQILFGYEPMAAEYAPLTFRTPFPDPLTVSPFVTNYYYRTHFNFPNNPANVLGPVGGKGGNTR